ncbi:MAG: flagellar motor switch protein FliN [Rubrobacteridae bacterium]|nr:flagellar motor switch protein FliN [Rubrobacteridae bacterium]
MAKKNNPVSAELTDMEKSALGEICDLMSSSIAKAFSDKLGSDVGMSPSDVQVLEFGALAGTLAAPVLLVQMNCVRGLEGQFFIYVNGEGLTAVFDLAVPEDSKDVSVDDVILDQVGLIINNAVSEAMANFAISMGHSIECTVVDVTVLQDNSGIDGMADLFSNGALTIASTVLGIKESEATVGHLLPMELSKKIIDLLLNEGGTSTEQASVPESADTVRSQSQASEGDYQVELNQVQVNDIPTIQELTQPIDIQPASFGAMSYSEPANSNTSNISLLFDVMLDASIELGRTQMTIEEILKLAKGSVIELEKLASEPVEFLVNGKTIARGEVVVIDDNFGIRITEILSQRARLETI